MYTPYIQNLKCYLKKKSVISKALTFGPSLNPRATLKRRKCTQWTAQWSLEWLSPTGWAYDVMSDCQNLSYIKNYSNSIRKNAIQIPWKYSKKCAHKKKSQWKPEMSNDSLTGYKSQLATRKQPQAPLVSHSAVSRAMDTGVWQCELWPSWWAMGTLYIVGWSINWYKDFGRHLSLPGKWECECPMTQQFHPSSHVSFIHSWRDEWGHGHNEPASAHVNED